MKKGDWVVNSKGKRIKVGGPTWEKLTPIQKKTYSLPQKKSKPKTTKKESSDFKKMFAGLITYENQPPLFIGSFDTKEKVTKALVDNMRGDHPSNHTTYKTLKEEGFVTEKGTVFSYVNLSSPQKPHLIVATDGLLIPGKSSILAAFSSEKDIVKAFEKIADKIDESGVNHVFTEDWQIGNFLEAIDNPISGYTLPEFRSVGIKELNFPLDDISKKYLASGHLAKNRINQWLQKWKN